MRSRFRSPFLSGCFVLAFASACAQGRERSTTSPSAAGAPPCDEAGSQEMVDYFRPLPVGNSTSDTWGAPGVRPRDIANGLEGKAPGPDWLYWDGKIIKGPDDKYHLFASRWSGAATHYDWGTSLAVRAVSNTPVGPYVDSGTIYTDRGGAGHNITGGVLPDGRFFVVASDAGRVGDVFVSNTIDAQFERMGTIAIDGNGQDVSTAAANVSIIVRPDGDFLMVSRPGIVMLSTTGVLGPYVAQGPSIWPVVDGYDNQYAEDPVIWYSGGLYHITINYWNIQKARHLVSNDGLGNWRDTGLAYDPARGFRYTDGTLNTWTNLERPGVLIENDHVTHFTFSALDVAKWNDVATDDHGSKVLVVPFDGVCFDAALRN